MTTVRLTTILASVIVLSSLGGAATSPSRAATRSDPAETLPAGVPLAVRPFDLRDVRLLDGPFRDRMIRDETYLLEIDSDRLLHTFRLNAGLPSTARPLGGWEAPDVELRGHTTGHVLSALSLMYASTGDDRFRAKAVALVAELARIQRALPARGFHDGYLSAFPEELFDRVEARRGVWAPYYTIHKIMAGLLDVNQLCGDATALDVLEKMAAWVGFRVGRLSDAQQQAALDTEFGGMNDVLASLAAVTGKPEYLRLARSFDHRKIFDPLAAGEDRLDGLHANTQIPKAIGAAREYEVTGEKRYADIAEFFWDRVANHRSFVIGGNSDDEAFFPTNAFSKHLGSDSTETCNTYNMLKLTRHLFEWAPSAKLMDFYERALFNHILASQEPASGMMTYYVPMRPGSFKTFSTRDDSFWCCVGTGMENHAKYGDSIYFHGDDELYVNLFIASQLEWKDKGVRVRQETRFPESDSTRLVVSSAARTRFTLDVRYPSWARSGITISVNGDPVRVRESPGSYVPIDREWSTGDVVDVSLPMTLHTEAMPDDSSTIAVLYGPIVLAGDLGRPRVKESERFGPAGPEVLEDRLPAAPAFIGSAENVIDHIERVPGASSLTFRTRNLGRPRDVTLEPFYTLFDRCYSVYWHVYSPSEWREHVAAVAAERRRRKEVERRTVDTVAVGDDADEKRHGLASEKSGSGIYEGRRYRESRDGWFSYELRAKANGPLTLVCTYWGGETRPRSFDVLVNGVKVATQSLVENRPGEFFDVEYPIPDSLARSRATMTVRFQAPELGTAGGVYGVRIVRP